MQRISTTPFGRRPVMAAHIAAHAMAAAPAPQPALNKWSVFRALCRAQAAFGLKPRDLTVLNALLTFHKGTDLAEGQNLIVFPSNTTLADRAHGMAESTLRRHLAALVASGMILRHDSPNGKRYARKRSDGTIALAFGFDLRPLLVRAPDIEAAAQAADDAAEATKRARETCVLLHRDCVKLLAFLDDPDPDLASTLRETARALRRKLTAEGWAALQGRLETLRGDLLGQAETEELSGKPTQNERHIQSSNTEIIDGKRVAAAGAPLASVGISLEKIRAACPDLVLYSDRGLRDLRDLERTVETVRPMLGISDLTWAEAQRIMGPEPAIVTCAALLQSLPEIRHPDAYLRRLTAKAADGAFRPEPMLDALLRRAEAKKLTAVNFSQKPAELGKS